LQQNALPAQREEGQSPQNALFLDPKDAGGPRNSGHRIAHLPPGEAEPIEQIRLNFAAARGILTGSKTALALLSPLPERIAGRLVPEISEVEAALGLPECGIE
jgi:hypothetical protein